MGGLIEDLRYAKFVEELEVKKAEEFVVHRREIYSSLNIQRQNTRNAIPNTRSQRKGDGQNVLHLHFIQIW